MTSRLAPKTGARTWITRLPTGAFRRVHMRVCGYFRTTSTHAKVASPLVIALVFQLTIKSASPCSPPKAYLCKSMKTHYETLGILKDASAQQIKSTYRILVKMHHPDKFPETTRKLEAEERLRT